MLRILKWIPYTDDINDSYKEAPYDNAHYEAIVNYLMKHDEIIYGDQHQSYSYNGIPVFKDGYLMVSMRTWGQIMADVMNKKNNTNRYKYIDFYMVGGHYV